MTKRFVFVAIIIMMMIATLFPIAVLAENETAIKGEIVNGSYLIRIPVKENDIGWYADEAAGNMPAVKLMNSWMEDGCLVVQYDPLRDGEATISIRHFYCDIACDQAHTWDLTVRDGKIQEVTGGSYTAVLPEEEVSPLLAGRWVQKDTQFTQMTITKNPEMGWNVEIISPLTHGAYRMTTTIYQDCYEGAFLYSQGMRDELPADYSEEMDLGEPDTVTSAGRFKLGGTEVTLTLTWTAEDMSEEAIVFEHVTE